MAKLNQIIAVANGTKSRTQAALTSLYHQLQKPALLEGISRTYRPRDEDGEQLPPEAKRVQVRVQDCIGEASKLWSDLFDVVATQDFANTAAAADVIVDGETVLQKVPVTTLLFLEKQLSDVRAFVDKIPTLDPAYDWTYNTAADCYATPAVDTARTKKVPRNHVKAAATDKHPAQVDVYTEDIIAGYWTKTDFSGAIPQAERAAILARIEKLANAVKCAREEANGATVVDKKAGKPVLDYLFNGNNAS